MFLFIKLGLKKNYLVLVHSTGRAMLKKPLRFISTPLPPRTGRVKCTDTSNQASFHGRK